MIKSLINNEQLTVSFKTCHVHVFFIQVKVPILILQCKTME